MPLKKGTKIGIRFGSGQDPTKGGRPKKMLTKFKEIGYSKGQVRDTYSSIAGLKETELIEVLDDKDSTVLEKAVSKAFQKAISNGDYKFIQSIVELFADKPTQHKVVTKEKVIKYEKFTDQELSDRAKELMKFSES